MSLEEMQQELYKYLTLNCGFIAHYDINGFKGTYADKDFVTFVQNLKKHEEWHERCGYFDNPDSFLNEPYRDTGVKKVDINKYFLAEVTDKEPQIKKHFAELEDARLLELSEKTKVDYEALKKLNEMRLLRI